MDGYRAAAGLLPGTLRRDAMALTDADKRRCEELRLRRGRAPSALIAGRERPFSDEAVTEETLRGVLEAATRSSLHAATEQLRRGYIAAPGGVRVGVCGAAVVGPGGMEGLRAFSSLSLRVPRAVTGCADGIWRTVTEDVFRSLLIISPPGAGKTTLLRELIRRLSDGGLRVCAADERGELAGSEAGTPVFDLGAHTDVLTGVPKAEGVLMLLRGMNPQVVAVDEITDEADARSLMTAVGCGTALLATVHGAGPEDIADRPGCRALLEAGAFSRWVTVKCVGGARRYAAGSFR